VQSKTSNYLATSVDRLCIASFKENNQQSNENEGNDDTLDILEKVVAVEIKCMTSKKQKMKQLAELRITKIILFFVSLGIQIV
jgi:hypothetical protein